MKYFMFVVLKTQKNLAPLLLLFLLIIYIKTFSQSDSLSVYDLSLSQLSKLKITSASKTTQNINEVPSTVFVITESQIKENGYFTLEEVLSDLPGFQFRNIQGFNSYVFQRGIPNQNNLILVLIDGVQINELNSGGFYAGGQYNLSNVERIEVLYGPSSVAYGTNAISGIINIITKNALENKAEIKSLVGSFNTTESDANYGFVNESKTFGFSASGMVKKTDKANLKGASGDNNWTNLMDNFENDYSLDFKVQLKDFTVGTNYLLKEASTATWEKSIGTIYKDYGTSWNIQFLNNYLKFNKKLGEKITYSSLLYNRNATVLGNTVYFVVDTAQIGYYRPNNLTGFENILNFSASDAFSITSGLTLENEQLSRSASLSYSDSITAKPPRPSKPNMVDNQLVSFFFEPRLNLFKSLYLSGGVRYDHSSVYNNVFTPRAGLVYHFHNQMLRFSYAEAFRAPKPWDYSDGLGNASLLPEKMKSLETALTISIIENFNIDLIGYKNTLANAISKEILPEGYRWVNSEKINTNGFEIYFRVATKKLKTSFNYTLTQSYNKAEQFIPEISKHSGNASFTYSLNDFIKINIRANYVGERKNPKTISSTNSNYIEPYLIFHGAISLLNYKGFTVQCIAKNIFNTEYYHTSNRSPDRYRQPQQTIMFSVCYAFNK